MWTNSEIKDNIETITMIEGEFTGSIKVIDHGTWTEICELEGNGNVELLLSLCRLAESKAKSRIAIMISFDNPRLASLIKLYKRLGAEPTYVMMEKEIPMDKDMKEGEI
jgi:hypothetical protein